MKIEDIEYDIIPKNVDETNFDIEKWRNENPMDYLFAMFLLNKATNGYVRNEIFKKIYKVTHLHIPNTLYKYFSLTDNADLNEQKLQTLSQQKVFMASAKYLNDPFDNKAYFYNPEELKKHKRLVAHNGVLIDDFSSFSKVTALTSNNINSMPMWAHYANNHAGFCLSYDMKSNTQLSGCTFPVQYTNQRIDVTSLIDKQVQDTIHKIEKQSQNGIKQILIDDLSIVFLIALFGNLKHTSWSYENEFRCTTGSMAKGMPYLAAKPKEIYIGMKCPSAYKAKLIEIASELRIPIYKMSFNELSSDFNLILKSL